ncbi:MAG: shikimate kinase [Candidatus Gastranaerophilales bacterium]|nr:shikimate kinase [Candidatus Gastranaerophilales bacterium]
MKYKKIALIGMMGSGKSTIARKISKECKIPLIDTDSLFEERYKIAIKDFFKKFGESNFRQKETALLKEISLKDEFILSTGGGIVLSPENREILFDKDIFTIYLSAEKETIFNRIKNDTKRPLLMVENPKAEIENILNQRINYYKMANKTLLTDNKQINEIVKEIIWIL